MKQWTEYRRKDYVVPRSMKEAYGWDVRLHIPKENKDPTAAVIALPLLVLLFLF